MGLGDIDISFRCSDGKNIALVMIFVRSIWYWHYFLIISNQKSPGHNVYFSEVYVAKVFQSTYGPYFGINNNFQYCGEIFYPFLKKFFLKIGPNFVNPADTLYFIIFSWNILKLSYFWKTKVPIIYLVIFVTMVGYLFLNKPNNNCK